MNLASDITPNPKTSPLRKERFPHSALFRALLATRKGFGRSYEDAEEQRCVAAALTTDLVAFVRSMESDVFFSFGPAQEREERTGGVERTRTRRSANWS